MSPQQLQPLAAQCAATPGATTRAAAASAIVGKRRPGPSRGGLAASPDPPPAFWENGPRHPGNFNFQRKSAENSPGEGVFSANFR